eukprot:09182.XXX_384997_384731_1 [CDS] Oithona nana genome sequencing.
MPISKRKRLTGIQKLIQAVPGKKTFGVFRFLPVFFFIGAGLEFSMIHWKPNGHNFYHTYKKRRAKEIIEE